jgi:hypothetical protein
LLLPLSILGIVGLLWGDVTPAAACSCAGLTPEEYVAKANFVLIGGLAEVRYDPPLTVTYSEDRLTLVDLRVERYLKGFGPESVTIADPAYTVVEVRDGMPWSVAVSCSVFGDRAVGQKYLLFLETTDPPINVSFCGGSTGLGNPNNSAAAGYLAAVERILGAGSLPSGGGRLGPPENTIRWPVIVGVTIAAFGPLAFLAGAAFVWRRGGGSVNR